jgi:hypothetical protein
MSAADGTRMPMRPPPEPSWWDNETIGTVVAAVGLCAIFAFSGWLASLIVPKPPPLSVLCAYDPRDLGNDQVQRCTLYYLQTRSPVQIVDLPPLEVLGDQCAE